MCLLLETIKVRQNKLLNIEFHNERVNFSRRTLFNVTDTWDLKELIALPELDNEFVYRCRFLYAESVNVIEFLPYVRRKIVRLFMVFADDLDYSFKFSDRTKLEELKKKTAPDPDSDILIIKNGVITDTSFANIAFFDGNHWFTPASPLLKGTKRAYYIRNRILAEKEITPADLSNYQKARLINAMLDLKVGDDIRIEDICL